MSNEQIARGSVLSIVAELDKRDAEIDRLRADLLTARGEAEDLSGEVERMREENSTFSDSLAAKADRIDRLGETVARQVAEIERLRSALEAISVVEVSDHTPGKMRRIALQALRVREALED